jgi:hypothetical protein
MNSNKQDSKMDFEVDTSFSMYTDAGDAVAQKIVELSKTAGLNWPQTLKLMALIADEQMSNKYGELMDTAVREVIYSRCNFTTSFYA